jgi:hypothetical protein
MVAGGVLCGAVVTLAALLTASASLMTAARHRSFAAILARAKLEELLAAAQAGEHLGDGTDAVDGNGTVVSSEVSTYVRRWHLTPVAAHPDGLAVLEVSVTPQVPGALHAGDVVVTTLVERQP